MNVKNGAFAGGHFDWATPFALAVRVRAGRRLCVARRYLADHEDRRPGRRARARAGENLPAARARLHGRGQPVDAARDPADRRALVLAAEFLLPLAGAVRSPPWLRSSLWRWIEATARRLAVRREHRAVSARLSRARDFELSLYLVPPSLTIWDTAAAPSSQIFMLIGTVFLLPIILGYVDVHLLAVPRQSARRRELPLSA